jgi:hypothetical protein
MILKWLLRKLESEDLDWIQLVQDGIQMWAFMKAAMKFRFQRRRVISSLSKLAWISEGSSVLN